MKNDSLEQQFRDYILKENMFKSHDRLLLAVSGGVDSVVLCNLCYQSGYDFHIVHCNFNLRDDESNADAVFVKSLAAKYDVPYFQKEFDTIPYAQENKLSIQVAARVLRYAWFEQLLESDKPKSFNYLLTAHHADDNVETILMNFFKGTGIKGLRGILPKHGKILRPLLFAKKEALLQYASEQSLSYREDSSNASDKYTRNFFRNNLIPSLEKIFPATVENLAANAERFRDIQSLYDTAIASRLKKLVFKKGEEMHMPVLRLQHEPAVKTVLFEIIKDYDFSAAQTQEVLHLLESESGKFINSPTHRIFRYNKWLIISKLKSDDANTCIIEEGETSVPTKNFILHFTHLAKPVSLNMDTNVAMLDAKYITYPLVLRKWKQGDYFYPLGMRKKKKLGRFLSDQKLSLNEKENTWVLESGKKIIWVVGRRIDDRFKMTEQSKNLLNIKRLPSK